jgi:hypothetical protein
MAGITSVTGLAIVQPRRAVSLKIRTAQSVTVVINDRGPRQYGATIDLARGAVQAIGMHGSQWVCIF